MTVTARSVSAFAFVSAMGVVSSPAHEPEQMEGKVSGGVAPVHHVSKDASAEMIGHRKLPNQDRRLRIHLFHQRRSKVLIAGESMFLPGKQSALLLDNRQGAKVIVLDFIEPVPLMARLGLLSPRSWAAE
jgi:hypothetical protein